MADHQHNFWLLSNQKKMQHSPEADSAKKSKEKNPLLNQIYYEQTVCQRA